MTAKPHRDRESDTARRWALRGDAVCADAVAGKLVPNHAPQRFGQFEVLARIGTGGHGIVFRARDPELDRLVAIKLCLTGNERAARRLMREAKVLAQLRHPNIVTVYGLGWHGRDVFIAMEHVDGSNVAALAGRDPSSEAVIDIFRAVGRGLAAAHGRGIVHRDIKPSNILLDRDDFPRIADFGLAQLHDPEPVADGGTYVPSGTWVYMAPEVLRGQPCDALSDQFSFCVSLWETLTGEPMFDGRSPRRVLRQIERALAAKLQHERVPAEVREILRVGLSLDPRERYPSMDALVDALDRLRAQAPAPVLPVEPAPVPVDVVELRPLVPVSQEAHASKPKRGVFVVALLIVGALGWGVGTKRNATRNESPRANDPVQLPSPSPSPCARGWSNIDLDPMVVAVCELIRRDEFVEADRVWDAEHQIRLNPEQRQHPALAEHMLIVARTFVHRANAIEQTNPDGAKAAAQRALGWALEAAALLSHGDDDIRVEIVLWRAKKFDD